MGNDTGFPRAGQRHSDRLARMSDREKICVDKAVLEHVRRVGGVNCLSVDSPSRHRAPRALRVLITILCWLEPGFPRLTFLPFRLSNAVDPRIKRCNERQGFVVNTEYGPEILLRALLRPLNQPFDRVVLFIGLGHAELHISGKDRIQVEGRARCGFHGGPNPVFGTLLVDHFRDGQPGGKIDAGKITAANRDEDIFGLKPRTGQD